MIRRIATAGVLLALVGGTAGADANAEWTVIGDGYVPRDTMPQVATSASPQELRGDSPWLAVEDGYVMQRPTREMPQSETLAFPADAESARAIRRMARGEVSAAPNRCAGTMREALGWGLGDAHQWTALPSRGYSARPPGATARPGDIVVWPFTYGRRNSQHVGIAAGTEAGTMLLSNLNGDLGLTPLLPGYRAFWKPAVRGGARSGLSAGSQRRG